MCTKCTFWCFSNLCDITDEFHEGDGPTPFQISHGIIVLTVLFVLLSCYQKLSLVFSFPSAQSEGKCGIGLSICSVARFALTNDASAPKREIAGEIIGRAGDVRSTSRPFRRKRPPRCGIFLSLSIYFALMPSCTPSTEFPSI